MPLSYCTALACDIILFICRKIKYEGELDSLVWKINFDDVQAKGKDTNKSGISMKSMVGRRLLSSPSWVRQLCRAAAY